MIMVSRFHEQVFQACAKFAKGSVMTLYNTQTVLYSFFFFLLFTFYLKKVFQIV